MKRKKPILFSPNAMKLFISYSNNRYLKKRTKTGIINSIPSAVVMYFILFNS